MADIHDPCVSVIIPTYNRPAQLRRAIASVLAQTFCDFEVIIVDDCSPGDATRAIAESANDARVRYVRQPKNTKVSAARNRGIREARGEYLAFLDDDDEWVATKLEKQLQVFRYSTVPLGAVGCGRTDYLENTTEVLVPAFRGWIFRDLLARRVRGYSAPLIIVRRYRGEPDIYFDENIPALEDLDYCLRVAQRRPLDFVPESLVHVYRTGGSDHVWNSANALTGYQMLLKKYRDELASDPAALSYYHVCIAREQSRCGRPEQARRSLGHALKSQSSARLYLWYAVSLFGSIGMRAGGRLLPISPPVATWADSVNATSGHQPKRMPGASAPGEPFTSSYRS